MSEVLYQNNFDGVFFLSLGTLFITAISVCLGFALKSKCSNVKLCFGCLEIERDIDAEVDVEMALPPVPPVDQIPLSVNPTRRRSYNLTEVARAAAPAETSEVDYRNSVTTDTI
jgi:hypothetical protein